MHGKVHLLERTRGSWAAPYGLTGPFNIAEVLVKTIKFQEELSNAALCEVLRTTVSLEDWSNFWVRVDFVLNLEFKSTSCQFLSIFSRCSSDVRHLAAFSIPAKRSSFSTNRHLNCRSLAIFLEKLWKMFQNTSNQISDEILLNFLGREMTLRRSAFRRFQIGFQRCKEM